MVGTRRSLRIQQKSESEASDINTDDESITSSARKRSTKKQKVSSRKESIPTTVDEEIIKETEVRKAIRTPKDIVVKNGDKHDQVLNLANSSNIENTENKSTAKEVSKSSNRRPKATKKASENRKEDIIDTSSTIENISNDNDQDQNVVTIEESPKKRLRRPRKSVIIKEIQAKPAKDILTKADFVNDIITLNKNLLEVESNDTKTQESREPESIDGKKSPNNKEFIEKSLDEGVTKNVLKLSQEIDSDFVKLSDDIHETKGFLEIGSDITEPIGTLDSEKNEQHIPNSNIYIPLVQATKFKFKLDFRKYDATKTKGSSLLKLGNELKDNLPFKAHLQKLKKNQKDPHFFDSFALDGTKLDTEVTERKEPVIISKLSETDTSTSNAIKQAANEEVKYLMKKCILPNDMEKEKNCPKFHVSKHLITKEKKKKNEETAGPGWYNLPRTEITEEIKKDLQIIKMRGTLDSKQHYKRSDSKKFPKFFQMGTIVEGAHEFYSSRLSKKERKRTMVDELLADAEFRKKNKKRMIDYQMRKGSGGKGYYKKKIEKRKPTYTRT